MQLKICQIQNIPFFKTNVFCIFNVFHAIDYKIFDDEFFQRFHNQSQQKKERDRKLIIFFSQVREMKKI